MGKNAHPLLKPILINGYCSRERPLSKGLDMKLCEPAIPLKR